MNRMAKSAALDLGENNDDDEVQGGVADDLHQKQHNQIQMASPQIISVPSQSPSSPSPSGNHEDGIVAGGSTGGCEGAAEAALKITNCYRAKHGVDPLKLDPKISAKSQEWADDLKSRGVSLFDGGSPHSDLSKGRGLYNSENIGESSTVSSSVEMYYNEIKDYDFDNPPKGLMQKDENGKMIVTGHFVNMIWKDQKKMGVGCAKAKSDGNYLYVMNYLRENGGMGKQEDNVPPPK